MVVAFMRLDMNTSLKFSKTGLDLGFGRVGTQAWRSLAPRWRKLLGFNYF